MIPINTLIHIKPSKTLTKQLTKQKGKPNSIKTGVNLIQQASLLPNGVHQQTSNLIKNDRWRMTDEDERRDDMIRMKDTYERWQRKEEERHAKRYEWHVPWRWYIRYNYYK